MKSIKNLCLFLMLVLVSSCAMRKHRVATTALDLETGNKISDKGILLKRGNICYINTTIYKDPFPNRYIFKSILNSNFVSNTLNTISLSGGAASISRVDTSINNSFIVKKALEELINNSMLGFQFNFIPQNEFINSTGKLDPAMVAQKYNPDYIINLKDLTLKISGDAKQGTTVVTQEFMVYDSGIASSSSPNTSYYGHIFMDYTAIWEIIDTKNNTTKEIQQNGRTISQYYPRYSIYDELMQSAQKVGKDFSLLLAENN